VVLTDQQARRLAAELHEEARKEWGRLARINRYLRGRHARPYIPENADDEYRQLVNRSVSNWLPLVVESTAQGLFVDGYRGAKDPENARPWQWWQANGLDARQDPVHRAALALGYSYAGVWSPLDEENAPTIKPLSPLSTYAEYDDPDDEWPVVVLRRIHVPRKQQGGPQHGGVWEVITDEARYEIRPDEVLVEEHDLGDPPVVRFLNRLDLLGQPLGEIEPVFPVQDRINETVFGLLMAQTYAAFRQRWATGMAPPMDDDGNPLPMPIKVSVDRLIAFEDEDVKLGEFAASDLKPYVDSLEAHVRHLAAITQTPPHYLLGSLVNLSAEALAAAEAGLQRKVGQRQTTFGEAWEQTLRLAARAAGDTEAAEDTSSQVVWRDTESRSLAQSADAITKLVGIGVPLEILLTRIPGFSQTDLEEAKTLIARADPLAALQGNLDAQAAPVLDPDDVKQRSDAMGVLIRAGVTPESAARIVGLDGLEFTGAVPTSLRLPESDAADLEQA
jgi:hypothetical protein